MAPEMPPRDGADCAWLTDAELAVYAAEYARSGFQGALQGYRCRMDGSIDRDLARFAGRRIEVPLLFVSGARDWGPFQVPGALGRMEEAAGAGLLGCHFVAGAGHWVQQERPQAVVDLLLDALARGGAGHRTGA
ncbi:pimeloyl-ACP methyl ester carboxylesterase [Methylobacterium radiotolerans]